MVRRRRRRRLEPRHRGLARAASEGSRCSGSITAGDLAEVFGPPTDFKSEWTPGEVERVVEALPGLQLPFDPATVAASVESLDQLAFEARAKDTTPALVDADVAQGSGQWRVCSVG